MVARERAEPARHTGPAARAATAAGAPRAASSTSEISCVTAPHSKRAAQRRKGPRQTWPNSFRSTPRTPSRDWCGGRWTSCAAAGSSCTRRIRPTPSAASSGPRTPWSGSPTPKPTCSTSMSVGRCRRRGFLAKPSNVPSGPSARQQPGGRCRPRTGGSSGGACRSFRPENREEAAKIPAREGRGTRHGRIAHVAFRRSCHASRSSPSPVARLKTT